PFHCNSNVAVNECIEAGKKSVKKKIAFRDYFFREIPDGLLFCFRSDEMRVSCDGDGDPGEGVMPGVRDHSGAQAAALNGEKTEHDSVSGDGDHCADALVSVGRAKEQR